MKTKNQKCIVHYKKEMGEVVGGSGWGKGRVMVVAILEFPELCYARTKQPLRLQTTIFILKYRRI